MTESTYVRTSSWQSGSSGSYGVRVEDHNSSYFYGNNIENFHARRRKGELLPHTSFRQHYCFGKAWGSMNRLQTNNVNGRWDREVITDFIASTPNHSQSPFFGETNVPLPYWYISYSEALAYADVDRLANEIQFAMSRVYSSGHDTLTFLAEIHKVRRMFKDRALRLIGKPPPQGKIKSIPGDWLEWRYGWRTLLFDLQDLLEAVVNLNNLRTRYSERQGSTDTSTQIVNGSESSGEISSYIYETTTEVEVSYRGSVTADIKPSTFRTNPFTTAWELLPYSFIVDWFIGIGQWLEALSFALIVRDYRSSGGLRIHLKRSQDRRVLSWSNTYLSSTWSGTRELFYEVESITNVRIPQSASPLPALRVNLDAFKVSDLIFIILQRFR